MVPITLPNEVFIGERPSRPEWNPQEKEGMAGTDQTEQGRKSSSRGGASKAEAGGWAWHSPAAWRETEPGFGKAVGQTTNYPDLHQGICAVGFVLLTLFPSCVSSWEPGAGENKATTAATSCEPTAGKLPPAGAGRAAASKAITKCNDQWLSSECD